jgi:bacteriocin resistance YdeI/OmpD-like protein/uncharacterized protein DUF1905
VNAKQFKSKVTTSGARSWIEIPFDPDEAWGEKERHYVRGTVAGHRIRGVLQPRGLGFILPLGPAWRRDNAVPDDEAVEVTLSPDGPQSEALAADIVSALEASPKARALFESVAPFYRKNFIRWIEQAKRSETREARIRETVRLLEAGKIQR